MGSSALSQSALSQLGCFCSCRWIIRNHQFSDFAALRSVGIDGPLRPNLLQCETGERIQGTHNRCVRIRDHHIYVVLAQRDTNISQSFLISQAKAVCIICGKAGCLRKRNVGRIKVHPVAWLCSFNDRIKRRAENFNILQRLRNCQQVLSIQISGRFVASKWHIELSLPIDAIQTVIARLVQVDHSGRPFRQVQCPGILAANCVVKLLAIRQF